MNFGHNISIVSTVSPSSKKATENFKKFVVWTTTARWDQTVDVTGKTETLKFSAPRPFPCYNISWRQWYWIDASSIVGFSVEEKNFTSIGPRPTVWLPLVKKDYAYCEKTYITLYIPRVLYTSFCHASAAISTRKLAYAVDSLQNCGLVDHNFLQPRTHRVYC